MNIILCKYNMGSKHNDFSYYLDNYKNHFIAEGIENTRRNKSLLENAKTEINAILNDLTIERNTLIKDNSDIQKKIQKLNETIEKTKKRHEFLEGEKNALVNSDRGAIVQNKNFTRVFKEERIQLFMKVCLIGLILMFLYNKEDVVQTIRNRFSKKTQ